SVLICGAKFMTSVAKTNHLILRVLFWSAVCFGMSLATLVHEANAGERLPILQGATNETSTQLAILAPRSTKLSFHLITATTALANRHRITSGPIEPATHARASRSFSSQMIHRVSFQGLHPGTAYKLEVRDAKGALIDQRELSTLSSQASPERKTARIALVSCSNDRFASRGEPLWKHLLELKPDVIFMIGDNVYADAGGDANPEKLWRRYVETRQTLKIFRAPRLIPVLATWDDHDYGANDADHTYRYREASQSVFEAFFAQSPGIGGLEKGPGVASRVDLFQQRFFFMDNRSFRNTRDRDGILTHWGEEQNHWLKTGLAQGHGPIWLINGSQFFGGYHEYESFEREHPADLRRLLKELSRSPFPTVFISGDRHLSEILEAKWPELGYRSVELTSSGIHSYKANFWGRLDTPAPDQRMAGGPIVGPYLKMNFMIVDVNLLAREPGVQMQVTVYGPRRQIGFSSKLDIRRAE
ncbi:MAG: alkaline phosphatase family protein, partial [Bdellovibrionaceae bacterium]|nr:alkaline phosphatase family protein [Pseudobdellovibrionaceae bacterium]